jgi:hypothetical protein
MLFQIIVVLFLAYIAWTLTYIMAYANLILEELEYGFDDKRKDNELDDVEGA